MRIYEILILRSLNNWQSNSFFRFFLFLFFWLFGRLICLKILFEFFQSVHGDFSSSSYASAEFECSSCEGDFACFTFPDSTSYSFDISLLIFMKCTFPHGGQRYLACCWSSNFLTIFLIAEPYLVPYLPVIPTFLVLLAINTE